MDELRGALAPLNLDDVQTFIASGNVVFGNDPRASDDLEGLFEARLGDALGYAVDTFIRTLGELESVSAFANAEMNDPGWRPHVMFGRAGPSAAIRRGLAALETPDDLFRFHDREIVWMRRGGLTDSVIKSLHLNRALEKQPVTTRTLKTVQRIVAKFSE